MRSKLVTWGLAVVVLGVAGCGSASSSSTGASASHASRLSRPTRIYRVELSGLAETPPGALHASGKAVIAFHGDALVCWRFAHLHGFTNATLAQIQSAAKGRVGKAVVALGTGPRLHHQGCVSINPALSKEVWRRPSRFYVNIRSQQYPQGAVRAQL